jgi:hypothetical protein
MVPSLVRTARAGLISTLGPLVAGMQHGCPAGDPGTAAMGGCRVSPLSISRDAEPSIGIDAGKHNERWKPVARKRRALDSDNQEASSLTSRRPGNT